MALENQYDHQLQKAIKLHQNGKNAEALKTLNRLIKKLGRHPVLIHLGGFVELELGRLDKAAELLLDAQRYFPNDISVLNALGVLYQRLQMPEKAADFFKKALQINPTDADVLENIGNVFADIGDFDQSTMAYEKALQLAPGRDKLALKLASDFAQLGEDDAARDVYKHLLKRHPDLQHARLEFANFELQRNEVSEARALFDEALNFEPQNATALTGLAVCNFIRGDVEAGHRIISALADRSSATMETVATWAMNLNYVPTTTNSILLSSAESWARRFSLSGPPLQRIVGKAPLRVGIFTNNMRPHPVRILSQSFLMFSDEDKIHIELFGAEYSSDDLGRNIAQRVKSWHDVRPLNIDKRIELARSRNLDVAITTSGLEESIFAQLFTARLAPIQLAAFGVFATTGIKQIDGFVTDHFHTPDGYDEYFTENLIRMPNGYVAYQPPTYLPEIDTSQLPENGCIVFGCLNNLAKVCDETLAIWSELLKREPNARLFIKSSALGDAENKDFLIQKLSRHGIPKERLLLEGPANHDAFLKAYNAIHVNLDPISYSGGVTTLEATWMGTPTITKPGNTFARRHSYSHLSISGLTEFICHDDESYIQTAIDTAKKVKAKPTMKHRIKDAIASCPISDVKSYANDFSDMLFRLTK